MALTAATLPDGALARNVVLFAVLVYELVGPALTKRSLLAVGEIQPEGRVSNRKLNDKNPKIHHLPVHVPHLPRKIKLFHKKKHA